MEKDRVFMSYEGRRIWWRCIDGEITYLVARGDGTDAIFTDWRDAMQWIKDRARKAID